MLVFASASLLGAAGVEASDHEHARLPGRAARGLHESDYLARARIDATDVDRESLERTRVGDFPAGTFSEMPPELAQTFMEALERAARSDETVVVEYELRLDTSRHFEARVVRAGADRLVIIVRDVTEAWRASELNRDLAGKLIASQEDERHRIARELHDNVSQQIALLSIGIDQLAATFPGAQSRFRELSNQAGEIATDIHDLSHELHPSKLQTLGLVDSLQLLCRDVARQGTVDVVFKRDVVPVPPGGTLNNFDFKADQTGLYRGQCAEFCGLQHGRMKFRVVALSQPAHPLAKALPPVAERLQESAVGRYLRAMADAATG
jgi:hypothetical protein